MKTLRCIVRDDGLVGCYACLSTDLRISLYLERWTLYCGECGSIDGWWK